MAKTRPEDSSQIPFTTKSSNLFLARPPDEATRPRKVKNVSTLQLFRYSDRLDKLLMLIGTIFACGSGGMYAVIFVFYGRVVTTFLEVEDNTTNRTALVKIWYATSYFKYAVNRRIEKISEIRCIFSKNLTDEITADRNIEETSYNYVILGFVSLVANYLANICWNTAAERQIKRIR